MLQPAHVPALHHPDIDRLADASHIPALSHAEAARMAAAELEFFISLLESLDAADWKRPTVCSLWDVRAMVAQVAGAAASYASWAEFRCQNSPVSQRFYRARGMSQRDAMNQIQVDDRANAAPEMLIAELRRVGPRAIRTRDRLPLPLRALRVPIPPLGGWVRIDYLTDLIYTRDVWMHRLDICRATGHEMRQSAEHDGRVIALMVRDLALKLRRDGNPRTVVLNLRGAAGGRWRLGSGPHADTMISIDVLDWAWLVSGRMPQADALAAAMVDGDRAAAQQLFAGTQVPI